MSECVPTQEQATEAKKWRSILVNFINETVGTSVPPDLEPATLIEITAKCIVMREADWKNVVRVWQDKVERGQLNYDYRLGEYKKRLTRAQVQIDRLKAVQFIRGQEMWKQFKDFMEGKGKTMAKAKKTKKTKKKRAKA